MQETAFIQWVNKRTPEERTLHELAINLESRYFDDMRLLTKSFGRRLLRVTIDLDDGQTAVCQTDPPDITISDWIITYRRFRGEIEGLCWDRRKTIYIKPGQSDLEHRATLLHEMLHAYESQLSGSLQQWLTIELYQRLKKRIPRLSLHRMIDASTHAELTVHHHGVLFLLKSLDLDWMHKWEWGTTFAYGRAGLFATV